MVVDAPSEQNGISAVVTQVADTAGTSPKLTRAEQEAKDRADFLAGDPTEDAEEIAPKKTAKPAKKVAPVDDTEESEEIDALAEDVEEDDDLDDDDEDDETEDDEKLEAGEDEDAEPDEEDEAADKDVERAKKGIAAVRKLEKRVRDQADARERAFVQERDAFVTKMKPALEKLEEFESLKKKKSDPAALMKALGYSEDDFLEVSQILYGLSKTGQADPKYREHAKRLLKDRELAEKADSADRRSAELEKKLSDRDAQSESDRKVDAYRARITKIVGAETPLLKKQLALSPKKAQAEIDKVWLQLARDAGKLEVDPKKVVRLVEKRIQKKAERAKALLDDDTTTETAKSTGKVAAKATAKKTAITVVDKTAERGKKPSIPSREDILEDMRRIERGELDPDAD